jgi:hypothetical protein
MHFTKPFFLLLLCVCSLHPLFAKKEPSDIQLGKYPADAALEWNITAYESMGANYQHSLMAARVSAMTHLAIHDALNAIQALYQPYALHEKDHKADPLAAVAAAGHTVLAATCPGQLSMLNARLAAALSSIPDGESKERGIALGKKAGAAILKMRQQDGSGVDPIGKIQPKEEAGIYQAVPPFDFVFAPQWVNMPTFSLKTASQFRAAPPPTLNSTMYTKAFQEVKAVGSKESTTRTDDQTFYAKFWYEFSEIGWNRVARTAIRDRGLNLPEAARLLALVNMALVDSYTAGWDSKFYYNRWRPYTAIRHADRDGNTSTAKDPAWEPLLPTPPVHDYPSTHSALGNAAATVLAKTIGNQVPFTMTSTTAFPEGATRSFKSFLQAADENADSRVMAGTHFRFACTAGQLLGNKIGEWTVANHLKPLE